MSKPPSDRQAQIQRFLHLAEFGDPKLHFLTADASFRKYARFKKNGKSFLLMDARPEENPENDSYVTIAQLLRDHEFSAPEVHAYDAAKGLAVVEDLGDDLFARVCAQSPENEGALYLCAIELLFALQKMTFSSSKSYAPDLYALESGLLTGWYLEGASHDEAREVAYHHALTCALDRLSARPSVFVHRDFHAENLIWLPKRSGFRRVGLLDFQDALLGHPVYDLVSLIEDARRAVDEETKASAINLYQRLTGFDPRTLRQDMAILGAQRNLKIIGIFARLFLRDQKEKYLDLIPRVYQNLRGNLSHPALIEMKAWADAYLPPPNQSRFFAQKEF